MHNNPLYRPSRFTPCYTPCYGQRPTPPSSAPSPYDSSSTPSGLSVSASPGSSSATQGWHAPVVAKVASLLDLLRTMPADVQQRVYQHTDPLTQYLHGLFDNCRLTDRHISLLWAECFYSDAVRLVHLIPRRLLSWELLLVHSKAMRHAALSLPELGIRPNAMIPGVDGICNEDVYINRFAVLIQLACFASPRTAEQTLHVLHARLAVHGCACLVFVAAAGAGRGDIVQQMLASATITAEQIGFGIDLAAAFGHDKILADLMPLSPSHTPSIHTAAVSGNLAAVQRVCRWFRLSYTTCNLTATLRSRSNMTLVWLLEHTPLVSDAQIADIQRECVRHRNLEVINYTRDYRIGNDIEYYDDYSRDDIIWIQKHVPNISWQSSKLDRAAASGDLAMVKLLNECPRTRCTTDAMDHAVANGYIMIVDFLAQHRNEGCTIDAVESAIALGHIVILQIVLKFHPKLPMSVYVDAAERGSLEVIKVLFDHCPDAMHWQSVLDHLTKKSGSSVPALRLIGHLILARAAIGQNNKTNVQHK